MLQPVLLWVAPVSRVYVLLPVFVLLNTKCVGSWPGLRQPFALPLGATDFRLDPFHNLALHGRGGIVAVGKKRQGCERCFCTAGPDWTGWIHLQICALMSSFWLRCPALQLLVGEETVCFSVLRFYAAWLCLNSVSWREKGHPTPSPCPSSPQLMSSWMDG